LKVVEEEEEEEKKGGSHLQLNVAAVPWGYLRWWDLELQYQACIPEGHGCLLCWLNC